MKKNKIIGLLVAVAGSVASIAAASALYVKGANPTGFGIGAEWHGLDGTITYGINGSTSGTVLPSYLKADGSNGGEGFGGEYTQAHYSFPLTASFSADVPAQDYVVGNFKIDLSNINEALQNKAHVYAHVKGYEEGKYGDNTYSRCFMAADEAITGATYSVNHDLAVAAAGVQSVEVYVKLDAALTDAETISLAESKAFDISVTWGEPNNFEFAHVVGDGTMWSDDDVYAMVPNINANSFEWMFKNLPGSMGKSKCRKGEVWSSGDDAVLDSATTYDVYWSGAADSAASYNAHVA